MLDRITQYRHALTQPQHWAVATVVSVSGPSPAPVGTSMAVSTELEIIGSLSGGCVESTVASLAQQCIEQGGTQLESFGPDGGLLGEVPLTCGGQIQVLIQPLNTLSQQEHDDALAASRLNRHLSARLNREIAVAGQQFTVTEHREAAPRLLLFGVQDYSVQLAKLALVSGWQVVLVEHRPAFAAADRIPAGTQLVVDDPASAAARLITDQQAGWTAACVMTHHPDLDVPVLDTLLRAQRQPEFIGALGSRNAQARRRTALSQRGHSAELIAAVRGPLGLDIAAGSPAESAASVLAELIAAKNGAVSASAGQSLSGTAGPVNYTRPRVQSIMQEITMMVGER
ncbi:XdhC family protein [Nesterenkonia ebinurensis]|uniref:XdhC family protein n=1 Tax=Nesterenkonia ebinurensis TaxID=2608252 RepID=UPI00168AC656|nr:XdhC family protein [Nesterenkonia ebinurensis]